VPPLEAVEAFIAATRTESFRLAAARLALSPSAFSRRIQALENFVDVQLFDRSGPTARLTPAGERYRREVAPALDAIRRATVDLCAERTGGDLRVTVPQSFAISWLIPRLPGFPPARDGSMVLRAGRSVSDLRAGRADLAIVAAPVELGDLESDFLVEVQYTAMTAPVLADGRDPPRSLDELRNFRRLAVFQPEGLWTNWLARVGYRGPPLEDVLFHESALMLYENAAAGLGVALGQSFLTEKLLAEGRLIPCIDRWTALGVHYRLVYADAAVRRRPGTRRFVDWLRGQIEGAVGNRPRGASRPMTRKEGAG
jgi:DNA-binding transcriptional LysR family regulator